MSSNLDLYPNLVNVRKKYYTQTELAAQLGITQQEVSRYERGEVKASINYLIDVADLCGVSIDYILGREGESTNLLTDDENELLSIYRKLSIENKIRVTERAKSLLDFTIKK
ncbi:MAG: helix-turn-helix transcriptional regulator [Firmicutes bacterium]|nr:helix-turn-helix transcriptional regulator [Bacillota bacterium]